MNLHTHRTPTHRTRALAAGCALVALVATAGAEDLGRARTAYAEWARVKSRISDEDSAWRREKTLLDDTLAAAKAELAALDERIAGISSSSTEADRKRTELSAGIADAKTTVSSLAVKTAQAESALRELLPVLPAPLLAELQPVIQRLPADAATTTAPLSQRVQAVAVALGQIEKFNSAFSIVSEIRDLGAGRSVEVKTLYLGIAAAFFADASGATAGYGGPGAEGWVWKEADAELAARIALAIAIHENTRPPAFVALPVEIR
jgi:hypothetical protein